MRGRLGMMRPAIRRMQEFVGRHSSPNAGLRTVPAICNPHGA